MPKLIVTSRYLRKGSKKNLKNYVKYIATREGVVQTFNERENYVGYLANRPNSHGLFSQTDAPINLNKVAKEISEHNGNVWTHVVSLRRDDAQKMGYDNLKAWRDLVIRQIPNIAKNQKIDLKNLQWYAAFHDKKTNPHVHIIVYSTNEREGFLTNHGIEKIRSGFANDIYAGELHHLYEQQTDLRNLLKKESEQLMKQLAKDISQNNNFDAKLINLISKLHEQLAASKGKKVYGYLKSDVKKTVDEIFVKLASNESIKKMYELWCEMEQQKHDVYSSAKVQFPKLVDNKEFKSVKNMIIQTVMQMNFQVPEIEVEIPEPDFDIPLPIDEEAIDEITDNSAENNFQEKLYIKWSESYKEAHKLICNKESTLEDYKKAEKILLSESNNVLALYDLGGLYSTEKSGLKDEVKSYEFYKKALQGFLQIEPTAKKLKPYLQYQIGMMFFRGLGTLVDNQKAIEYFEKSADKNMWSSYQLGRLYFFGADGLKKEKEKTMEFLNLSAEQGNEYAQNILDNQEKFENEMLASTILSLFINLSRCIEDD
ncbi:MAG: relaxase MobL, partial [Ruminococcus sp.]|nr:relaxase MobL [Ruminococcus sp.]